MRNSLKTTTALMTSFALIAPGPMFAQDTAVTAEIETMCADGTLLPCAEGVAEVPMPADGVAAETVLEEAAEPVTEEAEAPAEVTPEAPAEAAPEEAVAEEVTPEPEPEPAPEETAAPAEPVAEEPVVEEVAEPAAEEPAAEEVVVEEAAEPVAEEVAEPAAEAPAAEATATAKVEAEAEPVIIPDLPVQPDAASGDAPLAAALDFAAETEVSAEAEVTEEVVTKENSRSSDEDFGNKVTQTANETRASSGGGGLSDTEKVLLLGLGAVAIGAILSNNRRVELNSGDRVVVERDDGSYQIIKDDNALLRQPGSTVRTETFDDGSTRTTVTREDGTKIVTIRDAEYRVLRRVHVDADGHQTLLIDDTVTYEPVDVTTLPDPAPLRDYAVDADEETLRAALAREVEFSRSFSLAQVRDIYQVRSLVPVIDLDAITFETGSAAITADQARSLSKLGLLIADYIYENPSEMFLIEGHTDAVGSFASNLALSDRRAESVALALTEYFEVPPENLVVQGYGEEFLRVATQDDERLNRRASVRRITDLLQLASN